jgi:hypothetical protein
MYVKIARVALWVVIVLLLLPGSETEKREIRGGAQRTVDEFGSFCARNASFCDSFRAAYDGLRDKVRYGAELIEDILRDYVVVDDGRPQPAPPPAPARGREGAMLQGLKHASSISDSDSDNTLRQDDLAPSWRGPQPL